MGKPVNPPVSKRLKRTICISLVISLVSFIPIIMPDSFPFEIRNVALAFLTGGALAFGSLFILLSALMILIMRYDKWTSGLAMLLFPFLLAPVGLIALFFMVAGPFNQWRDDTIYRNGDDYLIKQSNIDGDLELWRLIKTRSPYSGIRVISEVDKPGDKEDSRFNTATVIFADKRWNQVKK
jgi:hypothetical protein